MSPVAMLLIYLGIGVVAGALWERFVKPPAKDLPSVVVGLMWPATLLIAFLAMAVNAINALIRFLARLIP